MKDENKTKAQLITELQVLREQTKSNQDVSLETLRKSEEQLRLITENTSDNIALVTFDLKAVYVYVNPSVKTLLGYEPEDLLGKSFFDFIHPNDKKALFPLLKKYVQQKIKKLLFGKENDISETIEFRFKNKIGNWRFMQSTVNIVGNQLLAVTRDVTERKQVERALTEANNIIKRSPAVAFLWKKEVGWPVEFVSENVQKLFGWSAQDFISGKITYSELIFSEDRERVAKEVARYSTKIKQKTFVHKPYRIINKDGEIKWVDDRTYIRRDALGKITHFEGIVTDITRSKQSEQALQVSEEWFSAITEQSTEGITVSNHEGDYIFVNPAFCNMMGYSSEELLNMTVFDMKKEKGEKAKSGFTKSKSSKKGAKIEVVLQRKDKSTFTSEVTGKPIKIGEKEFVLGIVTDITGRKQAQEALYKSENKYRTLFEQSADALLIIKDGKFTDCNPETAKMLGYTNKKEFLDTHPSELSPKKQPDGRDSFEKANEMMSCAFEKGSHRFEWDHKKKNGQVFPVEVLLTAISSEDESYIHVVWRDITERRHSEDALKESEEKNRSLLDLAPDSFFHGDENGNLIRVNAKAIELTGYSKEELLSFNLAELFTPESIQNQPLRYDLLENGSIHTAVREFKRKDGSIVHIEMNSKKMPDKTYQSFIRDITERKRAEETLQKSEDKYRTIVQDAPIGIFYYDTNGVIIDCNSFFVNIIGSSKDALIGLNMLSRLPNKKIVRAIKESLLSGESDYEDWYTSFTGHKTTFVKISFKGLRNEQNEIVSGIGLVEDVSERKQAEKALVQSERQYRILFEESPVPLREEDFSEVKKSLDQLKQNGINNFTNYFEKNPEIIIELAGAVKILEVNKAVLELHEAESKEELLHGLAAIFTEESFKGFKEELITIAEGRTQCEFEAAVKTLKGDTKFIILNWVVVPGYEETMERIYISTIDITERKQAEKALREGEERFRSLIESSSDGIIISDQSGNIKLWNHGAQNIFGYQADEITGKPITELMPESFRALHTKGLHRLVKTGEAKQIGKTLELEGLGKDGKTFPLELSLSTWQSQGKIFFAAITRDITERKNVETKLLENENRMRLIVEGTPNLFFYTQNTKGDLTYISPSVEKITGRSVKEWLRKKDWFITDNKINDSAKEATWNHLRGEVTKGSIFIEIEHADKHLLLLEIYENPVFIDRKVVGLQGVAHDVTQRYQAEEENVKLETQLRRAQKLETIGTLAGGIAHDFNNILAPIMGFTELALLKVDESEAIARDLNQVLKGAHRAKELVEQILLFSKQSEKERQPLALQSVVKEALKLLRPSIPTTIEISQKIDASCSKVLADATQIHQIVVNLCTNAWQSMGNGGRLTIELNQVLVDIGTAKLYPNLNQAEYARLSVVDSGCGMDEETLERIFEPFFTTKAVDKGTGLGLSVVHGIVRNHHGDILVYSEPKKGSAFHVYLPILKAGDEIIETKAKDISGGTEYVMIVDDEPAISEMVKSMLENFG